MSGAAAGLLVVILGLVFGSFATMLSYRLPRGLPLVADRSRCPACHEALSAGDLVPVLSWILAGGRCRQCHAPVSWRYPAIEIAMAAVFSAAWWRAGEDPATAVMLAATGFALLVIVVTDLEVGIIPDVVLIGMLPVAAVWRWGAGWDGGDGIEGAVLALLLTWMARAGFLRWRGRPGLGLGDVKLAGVAGLYLGLSGIGPFLVTTGGLGLALGLGWRMSGRGAKFPLGPALAAALAIWL